jgi:hypothetical protein
VNAQGEDERRIQRANSIQITLNWLREVAPSPMTQMILRRIFVFRFAGGSETTDVLVFPEI